MGFLVEELKRVLEVRRCDTCMLTEQHIFDERDYDAKIVGQARLRQVIPDAEWEHDWTSIGDEGRPEPGFDLMFCSRQCLAAHYESRVDRKYPPHPQEGTLLKEVG